MSLGDVFNQKKNKTAFERPQFQNVQGVMTWLAFPPTQAFAAAPENNSIFFRRGIKPDTIITERGSNLTKMPKDLKFRIWLLRTESKKTFSAQEREKTMQIYCIVGSREENALV